MLGITIPDAVLIGTLIVSLLVAWRGGQRGSTAKEQAVHSAPFVSIAGGIVEANQFGDYVKALDKLAIAMIGHAAALDRQHEVRHTNALEALAEKIDSALDDRRHKSK